MPRPWRQRVKVGTIDRAGMTHLTHPPVCQKTRMVIEPVRTNPPIAPKEDP